MKASFLAAPAGVDSVSLSNKTASGASSGGEGSKVNRDFEATLLQVLIEPILPKGQSSFGRGVGAEFARSQLSGFLAQSIAASGALGISRILDEAARSRGQTNIKTEA